VEEDRQLPTRHSVNQGGEAVDGQPLLIVDDYLGGYLCVTDSAAEGAG